MNRTQVAFAVCVMTALSGCKNEATPAPVASASAAAEAAPAVVPAQLPVKEDYEAQARVAVTSANLDDQLDQLEKQINQ